MAYCTSGFHGMAWHCTALVQSNETVKIIKYHIETFKIHEIVISDKGPQAS